MPHLIGLPLYWETANLYWRIVRSFVLLMPHIGLVRGGAEGAGAPQSQNTEQFCSVYGLVILLLQALCIKMY